MPEAPRRRVPLLFLNVLIIAICGLVYELLAGTAASYLLGDSVTQFSLVIGVYLSSMGIGAWLSRFITQRVARGFIEVQLLIAVIGGTSAPLLFFAFSSISGFRFVLFLEVGLIGTLVGLELPLLMRLLERDLKFKDLVSRVLAFDYAGALVASILFPLVFVPNLGLVRTSFLMGLTNAGVAAWATTLLRAELRPSVARGLQLRAGIVGVLLVVGFIKSESLTRLAEERIYRDPIVYAESTAYQRIVVTQAHAGFQLFLNGNLQLDSNDEYRYHEALVHPAVAAVGRPVKSALVLGGGDGLALRELLKYDSLERITLVDLDPGMTDLSRDFPPLGALNQHSYDDPRVHVVHSDAFVWAAEQAGVTGHAQYDVLIVDFPDPNNFSLGKLYTRHFYALLHTLLADDGAMSIQATSPLFVAHSYWIIVATVEAAGFTVRPYHATVPAFGIWGFALAKKAPFAVPARAPAGLRYLDDATLASLFVFPRDMERVPAEVNRLDNQILVRRYEDEGERWR